ncbi:MAG: LrgB family protein [Phycisphaerae bacterium]
MIPHALTASPLFGLTLTIAAYALALAIHHRLRFLNSLLITCGILILLILALRIPLPDYRVGADFLTLLLGPATVALAVPLYKHAPAIKKHALPLTISIVTGCLVGILSAYACAALLHASHEITLSVLPRSVTTPISMEVARALGGRPEVAAMVTVLSGLWGSVVAPPLLHACGFRKHLPLGLAMGLSCHGIGTATSLVRSELQGTYAGLAMALNGILTAAILTPLAPLLQKHL